MFLKVFIVLAFIRAMACKEGFGPGEQDWGFIKVRKGAHMFWWLHYTTADVKNYTDRPLVIWLQGGPGSSSTGYGNFAELGPMDVNLRPRNYTWIKDANVLFIDNPVGTGWSYVDGVQYLTRDNKQIAKDMVSFFQTFYATKSEFKNVPMYIVAESYGGKMAIEIALLLDEEIKRGKLESNLAGVALGNSWIAPMRTVSTWPDFLWNIGAVDKSGREEVQSGVERVERAMEKGLFFQATDEWANTENVIIKVTEGIDFYNILEKISSRNGVTKNEYNATSSARYLRPSVQDDDEKIEKIMNGPVKRALNLEGTWGKQSKLTFLGLKGDFMKPVTEIVEMVLNTTKMKVFVYTGQLDLIVDTPGTVDWVDDLKWSGSAEWKSIERKALSVNDVHEGYVKKLNNFSVYWINRAGHMVPYDNPMAMEQILRDLTNNYGE